MKNLFLSAIVLILISGARLYSQNQTAPRLYSHKVIVDSVLQTKAYTYLKVKEKIKGIDSLQWMALPTFQAKAGDVYYFEKGLQMGEFQSKELGRTFNQILFLPFLGTTPEISEKNIVPAPIFDTIPKNVAPQIIHTVIVKEVIQAGGYTYLRVKEGNEERWLAVVKILAAAGQTYTYDDAAPMKDFTSKELNRTFSEIYFLAKLTYVPTAVNNTVKEEKSKSKKTKEADKITIAKLYENKSSYAGKKVVISGEVSKFSSNIMGKNWIHVEDGTAFSRKSDITAIISEEVKVGDKVTVEGKITLDKDFGSGYFFEVLMEDAKIIKK